MIRLFVVLVVVFLLAIFIWQLKNYLTRDKKVDELREAKLEGSLMDIDKEIAEEKARQKEVSSKIEDINSQNLDSHNEQKKEENNE